MEFPSIRILEGAGHLPISFQIKNNLKHAISSGHLPPNAQLPSVRELAAELGIAANTVARAYRELQDEGLLATYAGRGTFVADIVQNRNAEIDGRAALYDILQPAITSARAIGYEEEQILDVVRELFAGQTIHAGLLGINEIVVAKWQAVLEDEFGDMGIRVTAFTVEQVQAEPQSAFQQLNTAYYIFSLITTYPEARTLFQGQNKRIVALITEVSMATHEALANLPRGETIGLVCEDIYFNNLMGLIEPYVEQARIDRVAPEDEQELKDLLARTNYVLHTVSPKQRLLNLTHGEHRLIEIEFVPNRACFDQIRQMLSKRVVPA